MGQKEGKIYSCSGLVIITSACLWSIHSLCALVSAVTAFIPSLRSIIVTYCVKSLEVTVAIVNRAY